MTAGLERRDVAGHKRCERGYSERVHMWGGAVCNAPRVSKDG
jgi:hypothetical protein